MRTVSKALKQHFENGDRKAIRVTLENATTPGFTFDETQIVANAFSIDRYCVTGNTIEVGSAVAAELALTLNNADGVFDDITFEGSRLSVEIGIAGTDSYIPCGKFTVDEPPRKNKTISLRALDFMMLFDNKADVAKLSFGNPEVLVRGLCTKCGVALSSDVVFSNFANYDKELAVPTTEVTYRQLLQWACQVLGVCAYIDGSGELMLSWYASVVDDTDGKTVNIGKPVRYSGEVFEKDIVISGVVLKRSSGDFVKGTTANPIVIENNQLIDGDDDEISAMAEAIYNEVRGFKYRPYECSCLPMPYLYPLDKITYTDKDGNTIDTIITNHTFGLNSVSNLSAKGETEQQKNYSKSKGVTKDDIAAAIAEAMKGIDLKTDRFYVMYSPYPKGRDDAGNIAWSEEPENDSLYIGTFVSDNNTGANTPESYKWIKIRGEDGQDGEHGYTPQKDKDYFDGQDGVGIKSVEEFYYAYTKANALPTNPSWSPTIPSNYGVGRPYLWNYTKVTFTNDEFKSTDPQVISYWSKDGTPGRGIEYIEEYYFLTNSESVPSKTSDGFNTNIKYPSIEMPFLWNYEKIKYTDKDVADETEVKLIGVYGQTGNTGAGIASVTNYYLTNNIASGVTIEGYSWDTELTPVSENAKYLWNYEEITY